mmetsp:Transcript_52544/g.165011  ORF Transcript_52544/g.165011 Transcript_52544/m.165011 type:complete len:309 (-) Transcript_52544:21-947(-)
MSSCSGSYVLGDSAAEQLAMAVHATPCPADPEGTECQPEVNRASQHERPPAEAGATSSRASAGDPPDGLHDSQLSLSNMSMCAPDVETEAVCGAAVGRAVAASAAALRAPLSYRVAPARSPLEVRQAPSAAARGASVLQPGELVLGLPAGPWVRLVGRPRGEGPAWVLADDEHEATGSRLEALWAQVAASPAHPGALCTDWPGLQTSSCEYSLEWRLAADGECDGADLHATAAGRSCPSSGRIPAGGPADLGVERCTAVLWGLPEGQAVQLRIEARLPSPLPSLPEVHLMGFWSGAVIVPSAQMFQCP